MGSTVYANGLSVACKVADGKTVAAFPDTCLSPPSPPAGPVPIPYPNTAYAKDTVKGSKTVSIGGQEIALKDKSTFKTSTGDEAATKSLGMGVVTHQIQGEVSFVAWSMNVKVEGENVPRHLDLTLHNEMCSPANTPPWVYVDRGGNPPDDDVCRTDILRAQRACRGAPPHPSGKGKQCDDEGECADAMACILVPKEKDKQMCCFPQVTGHHMIEDQWIKGNSNWPNYRSLRIPGNTKPTPADRDAGVVTDEDAPTVCANRYRSIGTTHREAHNVQGYYVESYQPGGGRSGEAFNYGAAKKCSLEAHHAAFGGVCNDDCLVAQLDAFYGDDNDRPMNLPTQRQDIGQDREQLQDHWGSVVDPASQERLTQNLGDILRNSLTGGGTG